MDNRDRDTLFPYETVRRLFFLAIRADEEEFSDQEDVDLVRELAPVFGEETDAVTPYGWRDSYEHLFVPQTYTWEKGCTVGSHQLFGHGDPRKDAPASFQILRDTETSIVYTYGKCQHCGRLKSWEKHT